MRRPPRSLPRARQRGAVLLLLLLVLSLGASSLLISALGRDQAESARELRTQHALAMAKSALLGYAQLNGRLPTPAASPLDGKESPQLCTATTPCSGYLPWVTLGIPAADSWGKLLRYSASAELTRRPILQLYAKADLRVLSRNTAGELVDRAGQARCSVVQPCVAAVILSNGKRNGGTSLTGVPQANGAVGNIDEIANTTATREFISRPSTRSSLVAGGEFDDLLTWIPLPELYTNMKKTGQLP